MPFFAYYQKATFVEDLFESVSDYFETKKNEGLSEKDVPDYECLRKLSILSGNNHSVSEINVCVQKYVEQKGYQQVSPIIQELYDLMRSLTQEIEETISLRVLIKNQIDALEYSGTQKDEFVQLMMNYFKVTYPSIYNGYLISSDADTISTHSIRTMDVEQLYRKINRIIEMDQSNHPRLQIIIRQEDHYAVLGIDKQIRAGFVVDSAGDIRQFNIHEWIKHTTYIEKMYYVRTQAYMPPDGKQRFMKAQMDMCSCSIFALDFSYQLARDTTIYELLEHQAMTDNMMASRYCIDWLDLPPAMVRNAQSPTFRAYYKENRKSELGELDDYFQENSLSNTRDAFRSIAQEYLQSCDDVTLERMMDEPDIISDAQAQIEDDKPSQNMQSL